MSANVATGLAITNPLVKYRALVATKSITPDVGQFRLAIHLQKLYEDLKDYEPQIEYSQKLDQISRAVGSKDATATRQDERPQRRNTWRSLLAAKERRDSLALTRRLTSHESALHLTSPKGLMLHGEVGTGKSMLIDLFADCLPNRNKRRWHFNTFMLDTFAKLESFRRSRLASSVSSEDDYSLMWLAKDMIQTSPILFLDEFQMPDRVASKILTNLMTSFFHLGGVLIATSNRMPEELAKASGIEFSPPPSRFESLGWQFGLRRRPSMYGGQNEFIKFLEVLKARCEVWEMGGVKDYRRTESGSITPTDDLDSWQLDGHDDLVAIEKDLSAQTAHTPSENKSKNTAPPQYYHLTSKDEIQSRSGYESMLQTAARSSSLDHVKFTPSMMKIYGRTIPVPRAFEGITEWTFNELCKTNLGPADYTTLASNYHTIILRDVPVLTSLLKNEARRFITLLDALYECRCKLFIIAEAGPDELFFPEKGDDEGDAMQSETFSEAYQDATAPFRPNILTQNPNYAEPDPEPNYTHARLAGMFRADALEDDPPNQVRRTSRNSPFGRSFGRTDAEMERQPIDPDDTQIYMRRSPDFGKTSSFTGEDERFAYKRAQSRLWEMCGAKWWARDEPGWHRPLPVEARMWERSLDETIAPESLHESDVKAGESVVDETRDEKMFRHGGSPFRTATEPPPKMGWWHVWGTTIWGPKAGAWGQGVDGLKDRERERR